MSVSAVSSSSLVSAARRLSLPLLATSTSVGLSMIVGDSVCQWMQYNGDRTRIMEAHALRQAESTVPLPLPDVDSLLRAPEPNPDAHVPSLPPSVRDLFPAWWDSTRGFAMFATGFLAGGPWQFSLQRTAEHFIPGRSGAAIAKKMAINIGTAPIGISSTFYLTNYFQGHGHDRAIERIRNDMPQTYVTGAFYWPFVSFFNLRYMKVEHRPIVGSIAGALWNIYISAKANAKPASVDQLQSTSNGTAIAIDAIVAAKSQE